ncbi:MAG: hypothetical protein GY820_05420, partial [Gammaproteobacteria bacterium]|nr:hypothetical protein [Gammaproteobacteria bacterium]
MAVLVVIQAFRGFPVIFKLSDFARFDPVAQKYRMVLPEDIKKFLMMCAVVIMYDRQAAVELLADTYGTDDTSPEFKGHLHPLKILDVAQLNSTSIIGDKLGTHTHVEMCANPLPQPRDLIRDIAQHITNDTQRFETDDILSQRVLNLPERKHMAAGIIHAGVTKKSHSDQGVLAHITGHTQAMWLYLLAEVAYNPGVLHRTFDAVDRTTPLNQAPVIYGELLDDAGFGCLLKQAVDPIFRVIAQFQKRLDNVISPYLEGDKLFKARLHQLLPGMYEYLSPFLMELKAYIIFKLLTGPS